MWKVTQNPLTLQFTQLYLVKISQVFISAKCANPDPAFQMFQNPHLVCARVLDTLRVSGLTYSLQETPFSATVVLQKKYIKNFYPDPETTS